jgi:hypothetical protein
MWSLSRQWKKMIALAIIDQLMERTPAGDG